MTSSRLYLINLRVHIHRYESYFPLLTDRIEVLYNQENSQPFKRLTGIPGLGLLWLITSSDTACPCFLYIEGATYHTVASVLNLQETDKFVYFFLHSQ